MIIMMVFIVLMILVFVMFARERDKIEPLDKITKSTGVIFKYLLSFTRTENAFCN